MFKKCILISTLFFLTFCVGCQKEDNCGIIINKISTDNSYLFVVEFERGTHNSSTNQNFNSGALISDVEVDLTTYNNYEIGENYCAE